MIRHELLVAMVLPIMLSGCGTLSRLSDLGRPPSMTPITDPTTARDYRPLTMPTPPLEQTPVDLASLWRPGSRAFFKDQRAAQVGDLLTVLVDITDNADFENNGTASRTGTESRGIPSLFGLKQKIVQSAIFFYDMSTNLIYS